MSAARTRNTASSRSRIWRCVTPCSTSTWVGGQAGAPAWQRPPRLRPRNCQRTLESVMANRFKRVLVTGGAGYVGSNLVPKLLNAGYEVAVLDLYLYGDVFSELNGNAKLTHISNDPSFDLNPERGRSINYDCFRPLVQASKDAGVKRFIYASSSSVYGIKDEPNVTEDLPLKPLTDYSKYKAMCEEVLEEEREPGF